MSIRGHPWFQLFLFPLTAEKPLLRDRLFLQARTGDEQFGNRPEHHKKVSFQEEYRRFLERYQITYDERYVWD
ncbi:MAG: hypothetical protein ACOYM3_23830 [Terrimicrobiaceae bacterium]